LEDEMKFPGHKICPRNALLLWSGLLIWATIISFASEKASKSDYVIQEKVMTTRSGTSLRYTLALPPSLSPDKPCPLVLALHYGGEVTPYYGRPYLTKLVVPALQSLGAIMIAPDSPSVGWDNPVSGTAVLELLEKIQMEFPIDARRLIVTGYSMGATGTWYLAFQHPDLFSAAIPVAGMPPKGIVIVRTGTRFFVIHSRTDELFPLEAVRKFIRACKSQGVSAELMITNDYSHYEFDKYALVLKEAGARLKKAWESPVRLP
jgi:predicted peptidase